MSDPRQQRALVLARPVDWADVGMDPADVARAVDQVRAQHAGDVHPDHDPLLGIYPGSVVLPCAACGVRCWVGPRSTQQVHAGVAVVGCYRCVMAVMGPDALEHAVHLGNGDVARRVDQTPRDRRA